MSLTKADIANAIQEETGIPKKESTDLLEHLLETIKKALEQGDDILISGFGKFCVNEKKKRRGRNPATGDEMMLSPRRVVTFKCSGKLRKRLNRDGNRD